jgi:hypothetical protein
MPKTWLNWLAGLLAELLYLGVLLAGLWALAAVFYYVY